MPSALPKEADKAYNFGQLLACAHQEEERGLRGSCSVGVEASNEGKVLGERKGAKDTDFDSKSFAGPVVIEGGKKYIMYEAL